jgi:hypothetical protein
MAKVVESPKGGKINRFQPGESGNPKGRPAGGKNIKTLLIEYLQAKDKKAGGNGNALNIPTANLIKLMEADNETVRLKAIQEIFERVEGKVDENLNLNSVAIPKISIDFRDAD